MTIEFQDPIPLDTNGFGVTSCGDAHGPHGTLQMRDIDGTKFSFAFVGRDGVDAIDHLMCRLGWLRAGMNENLYADRTEPCTASDLRSGDSVFIGDEVVDIDAIILNGTTAILRYMDCNGVEQSKVVGQSDELRRIVASESLSVVR